jgi:thiol-disulfide isomerase/thioredoxin
MRVRWSIAAVAATALALLTLDVDAPLGFGFFGAEPAKFACPANAKKANLSFTLKDMSNKPVRLADFKGKVVLLDFWATWCIPCKAEIPWFVEFQTRYAKDGLQVLGVSVDDTLEKLTPYVQEKKMNYPVLQGLDHDDIQDAYGPMVAIPVTVVISRDGKICGRHIGLSSKDAFEREIKGLL